MMFKHAILRTIVAALLMAIGGAGLGKIVEMPLRIGVVLVGGVLFLLGFTLQWQTISPYRRFRTSHLRKRPADRRQVLIVFLSHVRGNAVPSFVQISGDLEADLRALAKRKRQQHEAKERMDLWSWEQVLRGIHHNSRNDGPLQRVVVIPSPQSVVQLHEFADRVFRKYPQLASNHVRLQAFAKTTRRVRDVDEPAVKWVEQNGFDFEDFDEMTEALDEVIRQLLQEEDVSAKQIQIDFTGGQKPTSIVGAVVTLFSRVSNQYVSTNPRDSSAREWEYDVWGYDFQEHRVADD